MRVTLLILTLCFTTLTDAPAQSPADRPAGMDAPRPNILYFYVDDMGWGSIGPNGQAARKAQNLPYVRTPNLNKLAAEGVNFTRGYGATVCSPARSSQQTGFHQGHTFADRNDPNNAKKAMRADDVLMGDALSRAGYVTGYWGKWGYGGSKDRVDPVIQNIQTLPTSHGYQYVVTELHHVRAHTFFQPTLWTAPAAPGSPGGLALAPNSMARYMGKAVYPDSPARQNHPDYPATAYCDDVYAFSALDFVRTQAKNYTATGQPFFGLLAVQIPHAPFGEVARLPDWDQAYRDVPDFASLSEQSRHWAAMVTRIDAHFGNILKALEDPNGDGDHSDSVADHTLVIFQSDNGGPRQSSNQQFDANGGLRGNKGQIYEGGIRVPTILRWPSRITGDTTLKAGTHCTRVLDVSDLLPTFCELAGVPIPLGLDGVSIAPTLLGSGHQRTRDFIIHEAGKSASIIRGTHKLVLTKTSAQLFDLDADPAEANDLARGQPGLVEELQALLIGERVTEPRGFANTYHHWTGKDGAATSDPAHWSDYIYANAGVTYLTDPGAPRVSWTARMENTGSGDAVASGDADMEFLGLDIRGHADTSATQTLVLKNGVNLHGHNEIRISAHGVLVVNGGTVSSLRWIDIRPEGRLEGFGTIQSTLYNQGTLSVPAPLILKTDYREQAGSKLEIHLGGKDLVPVEVRGEAHLAGTLDVVLSPGFKPSPGASYFLLNADRIVGSFAHVGNRVTARDGTRLKLEYTGTRVRLTVL